MAQVLTCPRGHRVDVSVGGTLPSAQRLTCPVCGEFCDTVGESRAADSELYTQATPTNPTSLPQKSAHISECDITPSLGGSPTPRIPIQAIPGYEFLEKLGQGGMGIVFKARQTSLNRIVALKMILSDYCDSAQQLARFQIEAEALASLQHANIVQVHDVGACDGTPFFSMEFVDGVSLDHSLAGKPQMPREAARLVETLARAMHAAHLRGIVHRDLKPVNVLLTREGIPKIVDFGLAKRLEDPDEDRTLPGTILGTPNYMAPEQALGRSRQVGPATDVHALGVILYEMLAGQQPFRAATALATLENVRGTEPAAPSRRQPDVPRDLDVICLKCLHKDPRRRYVSAEALADDLRRFLNNEPIHARPVGILERTIKWIQRHPAAAVLLAVLLLGSGAAVAGGIWYNLQLRDERDRAERNFQTALSAVNEMLTVVAEEHLATEPHMEQKRRELLVKAQRFYGKLLEEKREDPSMRRHVALGHKRVGDIHRYLGENQEAETSYSHAINLLEKLAAEFPNDPEPRRALADSHVYLGELLRLANKHDEAAKAYATALEMQKKLLQDFPARHDIEKDLARTYYNRGIMFRDLAKFSQAKLELDKAVELMEMLVRLEPANALYRQHLGRGYLNLAPALSRTSGFEPALEAADKAVNSFRMLVAQYPKAPDYQQELAVSCNNRGNIYGRVRSWLEAEANYREALDLFQKLADNFSSVPVYRWELANTCNSLAAMLARSEQPDEALAMWKDAEKIQQRLVAENDKVPAYRGDLGMTRASLGKLYLNRKNAEAAKTHLLASAADLEHALATNPKQPEYLEAARFAYFTLAAALSNLADDKAAFETADHLVTEFPNADEGLVLALCLLSNCSEAAQSQPERINAFVAHAERIIEIAVADGRTKALELAATDPNTAALRNHARIAGLLTGKKPKD